MSCGASVRSEVVEEYADEKLVSLILCRLEELRRGGCEGDDCVALAGRVDIDLGQAINLVERGCPADLALRILL
jgi:hypothetical protein